MGHIYLRLEEVLELDPLGAVCVDRLAALHGPLAEDLLGGRAAVHLDDVAAGVVAVALAGDAGAADGGLAVGAGQRLLAQGHGHGQEEGEGGQEEGGGGGHSGCFVLGWIGSVCQLE